MKSKFSHRVRRICIYGLLLFLAMFCGRLIYGYVVYPAAGVSQHIDRSISSLVNFKNNYATTKYKKEGGGQAGISVDQKYEKVATFKASSSDFENDESKMRSTIKEFNGIIQFEQSFGNKGKRNLVLQVGVAPDQFDVFNTRVLKIGKILSKEITKKDKTNEFLELNARKSTLTNTMNSLMELKAREGKIEEYIDLENRILDIQKQLQDLGVTLGSFDEENEFCTVKYVLAETSKPEKISIVHRIKVALEWTIKYFLMLTFAFMFLTVGAYVAIFVIDKGTLILSNLKKYLDK